jgi:uncharacterized protein YceH (UPF0502 family)
MLKTISAALLAVSVLAAPALAASQQKTTQAPVIKSEQVKQVKPTLRNTNAKMGRHDVRHASHHRSHKHSAGLKTHKYSHKYSKATIKHTGPASKRG